jgi:DNA-3-methyladenine glycosylase
MAKVLDKKFFNQKTLIVARNLLGKYLVRKIGKKIIREKITEVEAYLGTHDLASHASRGKTPRNEPMFSHAGTIYVYFTYGIHWMLNIVTEERDSPAAVLIRGTENISGPARLTKKLKIDKSLNRKKLGKSTGLWIEDRGESVKPKNILKTPRIGIDSSGPIWSNKKYRFVLNS